VKRFECVPNFSEGRDAARIERIVAAARNRAGVAVLDVERNPDHHRSVVTLAGEGEPLLEALFAMARVAVNEIDLNHHKGEHPRMGAVDVIPFVPLGESTTEEAVQLAARLGARVGSELGVPVYLYGDAARRPERRDLARVREGQFEGLREAISTDPTRAPDFGPHHVHPTAGAVAIGARPVLIAYNLYLTTPDVAIAKKVAHAVRGRDGGLAEVKALGFEIKERQRAQVSMNLTDYRRTPIPRVVEFVRREADRYGVRVESSEIVGLVPEDALFDAAEHYLQLNDFDRGLILERKLAGAATASPPTRASDFGAMNVATFCDRLAARTPTPGGGSAAAVAGAIAAALGRMVIAYSGTATQLPAELEGLARELDEGRAQFLALAEADALAYDAVRAARKARKEHPEDPASGRAWEAAVRRASEVPLDTARLAKRLANGLERQRSKTKATVGSDLVSALALLRASKEGALSNVAINLDELKEAGLPYADLSAEAERVALDP
jgi:glutamate formiminotransferase / formiminotetrahydrofolate cyclodeaminase